MKVTEFIIIVAFHGGTAHAYTAPAPSKSKRIKLVHYHT